ncbi:uncharacterized protein [Branchiostoma lanceolatum]|uniref:uncharacterized protein n=1 Tax=Branchiostoma lanceolatum TaxID=7740 RepID=UPI003455F587
MGGRGAVRGQPPPQDTQSRETMIQHLAGLVRSVPVRQSETSLLPTAQRLLDGDVSLISARDRKDVTAAVPICHAVGSIYHTVRHGKRVSKRTRKFIETVHAIEVVSAEGLLRTSRGDFFDQLEAKLQQSERHVRKVNKRGRIARLFKSKRDKEKFDTLEEELNQLFDGVTLRERRGDVRKSVEDINENLKNVALDRGRHANEETRAEIHEPITVLDESAKNDGMDVISEDISESLVFTFEGEELSEELSAILCPPSEDSSLSLVGERIRMGRLRGIVERNLRNFHPETRQWLHDEVILWCHGKTNSRSFVLSGSSGMGKSCAAASICNRFAKDGNLAACYFPENPSLQEPKTFVVNLASQLSHSVPGYCRVLEQDDELRADLRHLSAVEMYHRLIHRPLSCVRRPDATKRMLLVLDGFDQLVDSAGGEEIRLMISQLRHLPSWLAILITSGETSSTVKRYFKQSELEPEQSRSSHEDSRISSEMLRLSNEDPRNQEDVRLFLTDVLGQTMSVPNVHQVTEILLEKSEGKLGYFHLVNFLVEHDSLTNKTLNKLPTGLMKVQMAIVDSVYTFLGPKLYSALLGCLAAAKEPVHKDILGSILTEEKVNAAFQKQTFAQLGKLTRCKCESLSLAPGIKSWLTSTESKHRVDIEQGHAVLALVSKEAIQNIMAEMRGDDVKPTSGATARYAIRHGMYHCVRARQFGGDFTSLFCNIHHIRVRLETDPLSVYDMVEEYAIASGCESLSTEGRTTVDRFRNLLLRHADTIVDNPDNFVSIAANDRRVGSDKQVANTYLDREGRPWLQKVTEQPQGLGAVTSFATRAAAILDCDVSSDGRLLACGDLQGKVRIHHAFTGKVMGLFETDFPEIRQCTFLPGRSGHIFFGSSTHALNTEGELVAFEPPAFPDSMTTPTICAFADSGSKLAMFLNVDYSLSGVSLSDLPEDIFKVKLFDLDSSSSSDQLLLKNCVSLSDHQAPIQCCCFVQNGESVVVGCRDKSLNVWDVQTGQKLRKINFDGGLKQIFTRDSLLCVVGDKSDTSVRVLDLESFEELGSVENHHGGVSGCRLTDDYVISACRGRNNETDQNGRLYATSTRTLRVNKVFVPDSPYISCCATNAGYAWVCGEDGRVSVVNLAEEDSTSNVNQDARTHGIVTCAFSPNSKELVTCEHGENGTLTVWDSQRGDLKRGLCHNKGRCISKIEMKKVESKCPPRCVFSTDGTRLVALAGTNSLQVWDMRRERHRLLKGHAYFRITCMALSADNSMIAAGSTDTTLCVWDVGANLDGKKRVESAIFEGHSDGVSCCAFSPDSQTLASGDRAGKLILWSPVNAEPKVVCNGHGDVITCLSFSADSCRLASGGKDGALGVWDVESGERLFNLKAHDAGCITSCEFGPSELILSSATNGTIHAWDSSNGNQVYAFKLGQSSVLSSRFLKEGKFIVSVSQDGGLSVLETTTGRTVSQCHLPAIPACMDVSRDQRFVTCGFQHGGFVLYKCMNFM